MRARDARGRRREGDAMGIVVTGLGRGLGWMDVAEMKLEGEGGGGGFRNGQSWFSEWTE